MIIYQGTTQEFIRDTLENSLVDKMKENFNSAMGRSVSESEYSSWSNSSQYVKNLIELSELNDNKIILEYPVPYNTSRIDCLLFGRGEDTKAYVVLIELKQWSNVRVLPGEENFVETYTGGGSHKVAHPSQQVEGYSNHLINFIEVFEIDENYNLYSCAYCHNYPKVEGQGLFAKNYEKILAKYPVYAKDDVKILAKKLKNLLAKGDGLEIFNRFMQSPIRPSKKLLENVSAVIENKPIFSLLNEQLVAKNVIMAKVRKAEKTKEKSVVIIHGGPGTGKSVIALNILADLSKRNKKVLWGCKSKPFREAIQHKVGRGSRILFMNLNSFVPSRVKENDLDIVIIDEAHRIGKSSNSQFTQKEHRTVMPQIEQLIRCSKTSVFFIDDKQNVRKQEVGSTELIKEYAKKYKASVEQVELISQFRCNGSDNYLDWIESTLGYTPEKKILKKEDNFEFKIFSSPEEMYKKIKQLEDKKESSARIVAGYCWPWSQELDENGNLVKDVVIGKFAMPWETHDKVSPPQGYVKWYEWAYKSEGIKQVGCIYTAQGFEFDYIGVIVGKDIKYDSEKDCLVGNPEETCDRTLPKNDTVLFDKYVKNIYRVLMTRGMKGCYVYFVDKEVEKFFKSRIE